MDIDARNRQLEALGIAESIAMRLRQIIDGGLSDRGTSCWYAHLASLLSEVEDQLYRQGEYAPENVAPPAGGPGYPGPCPDGMDWSEWLARNNVD